MKKVTTEHLRTVCASILATMFFSSTGAQAQTPEQPDGQWHYATELYAWLPNIEVTDQNGDKTKITLDDILKNLEFTAMLAAAARKDKWSFGADLVYMDLSKDTDHYLADNLQLTQVQLESWVVSPTVGYTVYEDNGNVMDIFTGARYLWIKAGADIKLDLGEDSFTRNTSDTGSVWDGIIGVRGIKRYTPKWSGQYSLSAGTGDSKSTWQAVGSVAYRFESFAMSAGWRYLTWEFENDALLKDMTINGPILGAIFRF